MTRVIAVDWSGAVRCAHKKIWLAEVRAGKLRRLEPDRSRREVVDHLIEEAKEDRELVVGLDFVFSLPEWFLKERHIAGHRELWERVTREGKQWLATCEDPFWGRKGKRCPPRSDERDRYRLTDGQIAKRTGFQPKSVFQIGGAGAVGTSSLRGMPHLLRLADSGFSIWPFDEPQLPMVIEIYPRLFTGPVVKSRPEARRAYLELNFPRLEEMHRKEAVESDDAFDALVSAFGMDRHLHQLENLQRPDDPRLLREGAIWRPDPIEPLPIANTRMQRALIYAAQLHDGQSRKGTKVPYISHLLGVCALTQEAGGDEEQAIAGLLHDGPEDQGGRETLAKIRRRFGDRVAEIVEACTDTFEDPKPAWRPRKEAYLERLEKEPADILLVACADKLYNARAILQDYRLAGDKVFERFNASKAGTLWYYRAVADALSRSKLESWLVDELERTVSELERATAAGGDS
jgi:hypothetical protein